MTYSDWRAGYADGLRIAIERVAEHLTQGIPEDDRRAVIASFVKASGADAYRYKK